MCVYFVFTLVFQDAEDPNHESLKWKSKAAMPRLEHRAALRLGAAFWGTLCIAVANKFHWGLLGPFNFSGLAITFLFTLLHLHPIVVGNSKLEQHLVKLVVVIDFMVSVALAIGGFIYFVSEMTFQLQALVPLFCFLIASVACVRLSKLLECISEPS